MKTMTCKDIGGPCDVEISANGAEEIAKKGGEHAMSMTDEAHMILAEKIKKMTPEENAAWMADFTKKWDKVPESK